MTTLMAVTMLVVGAATAATATMVAVPAIMVAVRATIAGTATGMAAIVAVLARTATGMAGTTKSMRVVGPAQAQVPARAPMLRDKPIPREALEKALRRAPTLLIAETLLRNRPRRSPSPVEMAPRSWPKGSSERSGSRVKARFSEASLHWYRSETRSTTVTCSPS